MAASDSLNSHLFDDVLHAYTGVTIDQALKGYSTTGISGDKRVLSPDELDEFNEQFKGTKRYNPVPRREQVEETLSKPRPLRDLVKDWAMDHTLMAVGSQDIAAKARDLRDLGEAIRSGPTVPTPIYRGSTRTPQEQAKSAPLRPLSFSDDRFVAQSFARGGGRVHKVEPGQARGIYVPDYMNPQRTVGPRRRPEREWLVDPSSIAGRG